MSDSSAVNDTFIHSLTHDASYQIFWIIIAILIGYILAYLLSSKVQIFTRTLRVKIFSDDFRYNVFFKYYFLRKTNDLNVNVYRKIKSKFGEYDIRRVSIRPESMTINPVKLGIKIDIELDCTNELEANDSEETSEEEKKEYQLLIKLDSDLRLTYKRLDILVEYIDMFEEIKKIVEDECFGGEKERKSFLVCDIIRDFDAIFDQREIIDNTKRIKILFIGQNIKIVAEKPTHLISTIEKYIGY